MECFDLWRKMRPLNPLKTCQKVLKNLLAEDPYTANQSLICYTLPSIFRLIAVDKK